MLFGIFFIFWRLLEFVTLIPIVGILSYFVHQYVTINALTPTAILVLFIVSVLAAAYSLWTIFTYHRSKANAYFIAFLDLCFVGAFIAAVYELRGINGDNCSNLSSSVNNGGSLSFGVFGTVYYNGLNLTVDKTCALLKAAWALGIMNTIMFFFTAVIAALHGNREAGRDDRRRTRTVTTKETRTVRRGSRSGGGSHRSHRSSHSRSRRAYV